MTTDTWVYENVQVFYTVNLSKLNPKIIVTKYSKFINLLILVKKTCVVNFMQINMENTKSWN